MTRPAATTRPAALSTLMWAAAGLVTLAPLAASAAGTDSWTPNGAWGGGVTRALVADPATPGTLYVGTDGAGLHKSVDGGASWQPAHTGLDSTVVWSLALVQAPASMPATPATPATLYAGTDAQGVFKSTDGGASWAAASTGLPPASRVRALAIAPAATVATAPGTVFAGTDSGVFRSSDGGATWTAASTGLPAGPVHALMATTTAVYAGPAAGSIYLSEDGGATWQPAASSSRSQVNTFALRQGSGAIPTTLYAGTTVSGVYASTDGTYWYPASYGLVGGDVRALAIDPARPYTMYAGTYNGGLSRSIDGGASWAPHNGWLTDRNVMALAMDAHSTLYAGSFLGGYRIADTGTELTATELMDWAQARFPTLFPGSLPNVAGPGYAFRGPYAGGHLVGVTRGTAYVLGPATSGQLLPVGTLTGLACTVKPALCAP